MSVILDALKKAQEERKRPGYRDGGGDESPRKRPGWIFYTIVGAALCAILLILFLPNVYKMQAPSPHQVAQQKEVPLPPPAAPKPAPQPAPQATPAKPPQAAPGKAELPRSVAQAPRIESLEKAEPEKKAVRKPAASDVQVAKRKPDDEPVKQVVQAQKAEQPAGQGSDEPMLVKRMSTSERTTTNYNNALQAAEQGNTEEARKLYMAVLTDQQNNIEALNNLGVLAMNEGNTKEAAFYFRKILEQRKDYPKAYNNLGLVMMQEGDKRIAEEYFRKAIEVAPEGVEPYLNLVALMRSEKRLEDANKVVSVLLKRGAKGSQLFLSAALIKDELGQYDEAIKYYRYYLQTSPTEQERRKVVERLSFLEESQSATRR